MKTIKEVSQIANVSIATLRYYDEIGLLKPAKLTDAGYRLYDDKSIEALQQIMFFKELEIPLAEIKNIMENPSYDKKQVLLKQKNLLEHKRNRINGIIELIADVAEGVNTMSFESFNKEDLSKIWDNHSKDEWEMILAKLPQLGIQAENLDDLKEQLWVGLKRNEKELIKWYGSKDGFIQMRSDEPDKNTNFTEETDKIYCCFKMAREMGDSQMAEESVIKLAALYRELFQLNNARAMMLSLAREYMEKKGLAIAHDESYGEGISEFIALAIRRYYGIEETK